MDLRLQAAQWRRAASWQTPHVADALRRAAALLDAQATQRTAELLDTQTAPCLEQVE